jgi:hypothetical protein
MLLTVVVREVRDHRCSPPTADWALSRENHDSVQAHLREDLTDETTMRRARRTVLDLCGQWMPTPPDPGSPPQIGRCLGETVHSPATALSPRSTGGTIR